MGALPFDLPAPLLKEWRAGNTGTEGVWRFEAESPGPQALVTALVHGNEVCGAWALLAALQAGLRPTAGSLTLAFCNLEAFDTFDPAKSDASRFVQEDLNRVWGPGLLQAPAETVERRRARQLLPFVEASELLLDLHSMHEPGAPMMLTGLQPRNAQLAHRLGTPELVVADAGHADGCRLRDHGRYGDAGSDARALLVECGYHGALSSRTVALDIMGRFLACSGAFEPDAIPLAWRRPSAARMRTLEVTGKVVARSHAVRFAQPWRSGQSIAASGTLLGWDDGAPFHTRDPDCVLVMPSLRQLRPGVTVMRLARERPAAETASGAGCFSWAT